MRKPSKTNPERAAAAPAKPCPTACKATAEDPRDLLLTRSDAAAGSPADASVAGEEDPGVGLEFLVRSDLGK